MTADDCLDQRDNALKIHKLKKEIEQWATGHSIQEEMIEELLLQKQARDTLIEKCEAALFPFASVVRYHPSDHERAKETLGLIQKFKEGEK